MILYPPFSLKYHDPSKINASTSQCPVNYHQGLKKNTEKDDSNYLVCNKKENETHNKKEIEKAKGEKRMK